MDQMKSLKISRKRWAPWCARRPAFSTARTNLNKIGFLKSHFYVSSETLCEKKYWKTSFIHKFFGLSAKIFGQRCRNCILLFSRKKYFLKKVILKKSDFEQKIFNWVAKLHSTCPEDHFDLGKNFKREHIFTEFVSSGEKVSTYWGNDLLSWYITTENNDQKKCILGNGDHLWGQKLGNHRMLTFQ